MNFNKSFQTSKNNNNCIGPCYPKDYTYYNINISEQIAYQDALLKIQKNYKKTPFSFHFKLNHNGEDEFFNCINQESKYVYDELKYEPKGSNIEIMIESYKSYLKNFNLNSNAKSSPHRTKLKSQSIDLIANLISRINF